MATTTKPASAKAMAVSKWPRNEPPVPCDITTIGNALPFTGALNATVIVVGPNDTGLAVAWLGYQMPTTSGLSPGSAATPCWKPAAWTHAPASAVAIIATAENRFDMLILIVDPTFVE